MKIFTNHFLTLTILNRKLLSGSLSQNRHNQIVNTEIALIIYIL